MADAPSSPASKSEIARLEELARRGWPAIEVEDVDGWLLAASGTYTRRANSVAPVSAGSLSIEERIHRVEASYARRGLPAVFKLQPAAVPPELDGVLDARGYARTSETIVMTRMPDGRRRALDDDGVCVVEGRVDADWFDASVELSGVESDRCGDYRALLDRVVATARTTLFGRLEQEGRIVSLALGCVVEGAVSFVEVVTSPHVRGRRFAERVLHAILEAGAEHGEPTGLLSVEADNASARRLYGRLGFVERYRYWYREQSTPSL